MSGRPFTRNSAHSAGKAQAVRVLGLAAGLTEVVVGVPLGIATAVDMGRFSMFAIGPIVSLVLLVVFAQPALWQRLSGSAEGGPSSQAA